MYMYNVTAIHVHPPPPTHTGTHTHTHIRSKDIGSQVLDISQRNVHRNLQDLELAGEIRVKELDWRTPFHPNSNS